MVHTAYMLSTHEVCTHETVTGVYELLVFVFFFSLMPENELSDGRSIGQFVRYAVVVTLHRGLDPQCNLCKTACEHIHLKLRACRFAGLRCSGMQIASV